jgi:hypothetical protein
LPGKLHTIPSDFDSQCFKDLMVNISMLLDYIKIMLQLK